MGSKVSAFVRMGRSRQLSLLQAAAILAAVWAGLRVAGYGRTRSALARTARVRACRAGRSQAVGANEVEAVVSELGWAVAAAAQYAPFSATCLHRTLALWWLLRRRGIESDVRIGTVRTETGLAAHAWLERDGVALNDAADVGERFAAFEIVDVGKGR